MSLQIIQFLHLFKESIQIKRQTYEQVKNLNKEDNCKKILNHWNDGDCFGILKCIHSYVRCSYCFLVTLVIRHLKYISVYFLNCNFFPSIQRKLTFKQVLFIDKKKQSWWNCYLNRECVQKFLPYTYLVAKSYTVINHRLIFSVFNWHFYAFLFKFPSLQVL